MIEYLNELLAKSGVNPGFLGWIIAMVIWGWITDHRP